MLAYTNLNIVKIFDHFFSQTHIVKKHRNKRH